MQTTWIYSHRILLRYNLKPLFKYQFDSIYIYIVNPSKNPAMALCQLKCTGKYWYKIHLTCMFKLQLTKSTHELPLAAWCYLV